MAVLVFTMAIHQVISQVISLQRVAITQHWSMMSALLFFSKFVNMPPRVQSMWKYERVIGYIESTFWDVFGEDVSTTIQG